jgi:hypothetical protein
MKKIFVILTAVCFTLLLSAALYAQAVIAPEAFVYSEQEINGQPMILRVPHPEEEKQALDQQSINTLQAQLQTEGVIQQQQDPHAVAAWTYWWNQLKLWQRYTKDDLFHEPLQQTIESTDFTNQDTVKQSVDSTRNTLVTQSEQINDQQHQQNLQFLERLMRRETQRTQYADWVQSREALLLEFADRWVKRMKGEILNIDGNTYLISSQPLQKIPRDTINIVTRKLTPYDLLNSDGSLKAIPKD